MCFLNIMLLGCFYYLFYYFNFKSVLEIKRLCIIKILIFGFFMLFVDGYLIMNVLFKKNFN